MTRDKHKKFKEALERVLSVTHSEIKQIEESEKEKRNYTSKKRGKKPKPPAS